MEKVLNNNLAEIAEISCKIGELIDFNNKLIAALNTSVEGIALMDENGIYIYVNKAHAEMFGYPIKDLIGSSWQIHYSEEDLAQLGLKVFPEIEKNGFWKGITNPIPKNGDTKLKIELTLTALPDGGLICTSRKK